MSHQIHLRNMIVNVTALVSKPYILDSWDKRLTFLSIVDLGKNDESNYIAESLSSAFSASSVRLF
jgi:hypothetical protein